MPTQRFDSIGDFIRDAEKRISFSEDKRDWFGNQSEREAADCALHGDERYTTQAATWFERYCDLLPSTVAYGVINSPFGARFNVAELLNEGATPFRRRARLSSDINPLHVVVSLTSSGGIEAADCEKRGMAVLALVQAIEQVRPVTLDLMVELDGRPDGYGYVLMGIETPLSLSQSAFALCSEGFTRGIAYKWLKASFGSFGRWPEGFSSDSRVYTPLVKQRLGLSEADLFIPPIYLSDDAIRNPEKWLQDKLKQVLPEGA